MSLMPIYDYGSALQLNWNFKSTYNKSKTFNGYLTKDLQENVLQKRANNLLSSGKNNVMFGVRTPLIDANTKFHTNENDRRETFTKDSLLVLMRELAHEMQHNKELRAFYENIKRQVDFYHIRDFMQIVSTQSQTNNLFLKYILTWQNKRSKHRALCLIRRLKTLNILSHSMRMSIKFSKKINLETSQFTTKN